VTLAVASFAEGTVALAAALAAAGVLALHDPRRRALAMPVALALAAAAVGLLSAGRIGDELSGRAALAAVAAVAGVAAVAALAVLFYRRPAVFVLLAIAALPFRVPVPTGNDDTASLLLPSTSSSPRAVRRTSGARSGLGAAGRSWESGRSRARAASCSRSRSSWCCMRCRRSTRATSSTP
jgi:hypothetical protein